MTRPSHFSPYRPSTALCLVIGLSAFGLTACSVTPEPVTLDEQMAQTASDRLKMFADQEPVTGPISIDEAMARAVKYNLQQRMGLMEKALEDQMLDVRSLDMLPKLAAQAGWKTRSNEAASSSESIESRSQSLEPSTSQDKNGETAGLQLSWNVLDFGVNYFGAKAQANKALAAEERRRRVIADIIQQVRVAYWEAATAERLQPEVRQAMDEANMALDRARQTERERLMTPADSLRYQKSLLEMVRQLEALDGELADAKARLAALMNIPPATDYTLEPLTESSFARPALAYGLDELEATAMVKRPEIREETYQARNAVLETRMALLKLLPGANLFTGVNYDSNSYLVNSSWADAGLQVSWNLFNVLSYSRIEEAGETRERLAELRRQAVRMAVLTQVNLSWQRYHRAERIFDRSNELEQLQRGLLGHSESAYASNAQSLLERIRTRTETVLATRTRDRSFAEMQGAYGAIYQAAGLDPLPEQVKGYSIADLSGAIAANRAALARGEVAPPQLLPAPVAVASSAPAVQPVTLASPPPTPPAPVEQPAAAPAAVEVAATPPVPPAYLLRLDMWSHLGSLEGAELISLDGPHVQ